MPDSSTRPLPLRRFAFLHRFGPPTLIMLGSLWVLQSVFAHTSSHGVIIRSLSYDAGAVKAGSTVTDNVHLINLSSQPIEVEAQPGCGCTVADVPDKPLAPMHSEIVRLEVDTDGIKGEATKKVLFDFHSNYQEWEQVAEVNFHVK